MDTFFLDFSDKVTRKSENKSYTSKSCKACVIVSQRKRTLKKSRLSGRPARLKLSAMFGS